MAGVKIEGSIFIEMRQLIAGGVIACLQGGVLLFSRNILISVAGAAYGVILCRSFYGPR